MPSLNVACVAFMNSASLMPSMRLKLMMSGIVASPTPMIPISSDSTSVIDTSFGLSRLESAVSIIHPTEPPPAMTMRLNNGCMGSPLLLFQVAHQIRHVFIVRGHGSHQLLDVVRHIVERGPRLGHGFLIGEAIVACRPPAHAEVLDGPVFRVEGLQVERHQQPATRELRQFDGQHL